ncbi:aldo/keto reductase [Pseudenhygromyxa sp. WMMC2535]|uniref:aldo/keto reductase n=1 Tax=Pseudenhygromyxa sp. WMMC2535 TaxID=2712867 RepID=UPI00155529F3|nr:aldo/keto reductase [Pseudenhygromyxa sp. WMMC2535]NVB39589.1 aldo/keto reductase [Pseudenhygromyxa sp. WMMC2535]
MEYRNLGASGLKVSTLCLGTMTFGEADEKSFMHKVSSDEATAHAILERALEAGVNFIDTADVYGQDGLSERVIGDWFTNSGRRDEVVLATKFRFRMSPGPNGTGASRRRIVKTVEDSLRRLQTDRIDLYQIHMQDLDVPEAELLRALDDLVRAGKVLYIGASNYAAHRLKDSLWTSKVEGLERFVALQMKYSPLTRDLEREHVPICVNDGLGLIPWSPLEGGFLTGKYRRDQPPPEGARLEVWRKRFEKMIETTPAWDVLEAIVAVAEALEASPAAVTLAWLLRRPGVASVIFGARTMKQLESNLEAATLELSDEQVESITAARKFEPGYPYEFIAGVQGRW